MADQNDNSLNMERAIGRLEGKLDSVVSIVGELKGSFDTMEKGRLSALEVKFATLATEVSVKAKNSAILNSAIVAVGVSVLSAVITYLLNV